MSIDLFTIIVVLVTVILVLVVSLLLWLRFTNRMTDASVPTPIESASSDDVALYRMLIIDAQSLIHDEKSLIAKIKLATGGMQERVTGKRGPWSNKLKSEVQHELDSVRQDVDKLKDMMDGLLVNFERNDLSLQLEQVNIGALCEEVKNSLQAEANQHQVHLVMLQPRLHPLPQTDLQVPVDRELIKRVLIELIRNGIKFSKPPDSQVAIAFKRDGDHLTIQVLNNGLKIPDDDMNKIFEPGFRGQQAAQTPGTGIGLFTVKIIVKEHQGQLDVDNHPKDLQQWASKTKWSTVFTLKLPYQQYRK